MWSDHHSLALGDRAPAVRIVIIGPWSSMYCRRISGLAPPTEHRKESLKGFGGRFGQPVQKRSRTEFCPFAKREKISDRCRKQGNKFLPQAEIGPLMRACAFTSATWEQKGADGYGSWQSLPPSLQLPLKKSLRSFVSGSAAAPRSGRTPKISCKVFRVELWS